MIVIQTYKRILKTDEPIYKDYYATGGVLKEMEIINQDGIDNDRTIYSDIIIYNIFDTDEE